MYSAGDKLPESTEEDDSTPLGKLFRLRWGNGSTGGVLHSSGEHSYIPLRNIKTARDTLMFAGGYPYTPPGNIKTFWGIPNLFSADGGRALLGGSIADLFIVASLSWESHHCCVSLGE